MDFWRDGVKPRSPGKVLDRYGSICGAYIFGILLLALAIFDRRTSPPRRMWAKLLLTVLCLSMIQSRPISMLARTVAVAAAAHDGLVCV